MYPKFSYTLCVGDTGSIYIRKLDYVSLPHRKKFHRQIFTELLRR
jgi:hypothetical protein